MDLSKQTNDQLNALCRQNNIKGYSKLKKDDKIAKLVDAGITSTSAPVSKKVVKGKKAEEKEVKEKKPTKPRVEKLDKTLAKEIKPEQFKEALLEHKEELSVKEIVELLKEEIENFVNNAELAKIIDLVDKFGALTALDYQRTHKNSKLSAKEDSEVYKTLLLHLFMTNEKASDALVKAIRKFHAKLLKPVAEKKPKKLGDSKKVTKVAEPDEDEEDEDEDEDNEEIDVGEEPEYNDSEEDI